MAALERLADVLSGAESGIAFTGAGVSTASGIPDFRSEGGVWEQHDQSDFYYDRFQRDPSGFWADRVALQETMYGDIDPAPNAAHHALAKLAAEGYLEAIITQNVDGLHADAAAATGVDHELVELHGNARAVVCQDCGEQSAAAPAFEQARRGEQPPTCAACGGVLKPDVVLFGERLDSTDLDRARQLARRAEVFIAAGSSLTVEPAASLPRLATRTGGTLAVINYDETPYSDQAEFDLRADVTEVLPDLYETVQG